MKIDPKLKIKGRFTIKKSSWFKKLISKLDKHEIEVRAVEKEQDVQDKRPCLTRPGGDPNYQVPVEESRRELSLRDLLRK